VKDICRRAGLTDRYFYESFRDSSALFTAVFDRATAYLFEVVAAALAAAPARPEEQSRAVIEVYVGALADDPRLARIVFVEAPSAGPEVERHMRETLRRFARLMIEWQDGELRLPIEQIIDYLVGMLLAAGRVAGLNRSREKRSSRRDGLSSSGQ